MNAIILRDRDFHQRFCNLLKIDSVPFVTNKRVLNNAKKIFIMHMVPVAILAIIGVFTVLLTGVILFFRTRHRERLALIKYDKDASIFKPNKSPKRSTLKWALLAMGAGAGILVGTAIDSIFWSAPGGVFSCLLIFGGAALFIYYSLMNKEVRAQVEDEDEFI